MPTTASIENISPKSYDYSLKMCIFAEKKFKKVRLTIRQFNAKLCFLDALAVMWGNLLTVLRGRKLPGCSIKPRQQ